MDATEACGLFSRGNLATPREGQRGARSKVKERFLDDLCADYEKHGKAAIERIRESDPVAFIKVIASLVPREIRSEHKNRFENWTEEEINSAILAHLASLFENKEGGEPG
jgi:hypothetical protein